MRDIQQVLERWGRWANNSTGTYYPTVSPMFRGALPTAGNPLSCSDEDGLIIDMCVARLRVINRSDELYCIELYYMYGWSKRAIARHSGCNEREVRRMMQVAESFIAGCLEMLDIALDMDDEVNIEKPCAARKNYAMV
ncbi:antiterminator Q family protein [Photorhabdus heterorhabditis]|uniref:antiterminator Q family protein n=1 Tax=Photorhabdus heterorhabditis TaxID=880156 RepID=UPI0015624DD1|nr:antiterminator Q family protein [Photorhabdus heterorhabditis]NRN27890.1 antitermination protein Q [Photorhabdus heterorhabditis subsp. aluminescens]